MSPVTLSIVTVVRNDRLGFLRTARSVGAQKTAAIEWIVRDGASTDGTLDAAHALLETGQIDRVVSCPDGGIYPAMQAGASDAMGQYLLFLNAGDALLPGALAAFQSVIPKEGPLPVIFGDWMVVDTERSRPRRANIDKLCYKMSVNHQASFIPAEAFWRDGGYRRGLRLSADFDLLLRLWLRGEPMQRLPVPVVSYQRGGLSDQRRLRTQAEIAWSLWYNRSPGRVGGTKSILHELLQEHLGQIWWSRLVSAKRRVLGRSSRTDRHRTQG